MTIRAWVILIFLLNLIKVHVDPNIIATALVELHPGFETNDFQNCPGCKGHTAENSCWRTVARKIILHEDKRTVAKYARIYYDCFRRNSVQILLKIQEILTARLLDIPHLNDDPIRSPSNIDIVQHTEHTETESIDFGFNSNKHNLETLNFCQKSTTAEVSNDGLIVDDEAATILPHDIASPNDSPLRSTDITDIAPYSQLLEPKSINLNLDLH